MLSDEYPANLNEMLEFSFKFDNLIKIIEFLHRHNMNLKNEIKDLGKKIEILSQLKSQVDNLDIKAKNLEKNNKEINQTLVNHNDKFLDLESQLNNIKNKSDETKEQINSIDKKVEGHDYNLNNLNKIVEEHIKDSKEQKKDIDSIKITLSQNQIEFEKVKNELNDMSNDFNEIKNNFNEFKKEQTKTKEEQNKKLFNNEKSIVTLIATINEIKATANQAIKIASSSLQTKQESTVNENIDNNEPEKKEGIESKEINMNMNFSGNSMVNFAMTEIENLQKNFNEFKSEYNEFKEKYDNENKNKDNNIKNINENLKTLDENIQNIINGNTDNIKTISIDSSNNKRRESRKKDSIFENEVNIENILNIIFNSEQFKKMNDSLRIITYNIGNKVNKDELENSNRNIIQRLEKLDDRVNEYIKSQDQKLSKFKSTNLSNNQNQNPAFDMDFFTQNLETQIQSNIKTITYELLKTEGAIIDLHSNPQIKELIENLNKHSDEINKNYKSIIDIRNMLLNNEMEKKFQLLQGKLNKIEEDGRFTKLKLADLIKNVEGEEEDDDNANGTIQSDQNKDGITIREKLNLLTGTSQQLRDKVDILERKQNNLTKEVKDDIKQNLKQETLKVVEQFKLKLESFTTRFEHELKNKIDQMGLSSFEHKINNKFYGDLREKLDRNELRKNNNQINRKIDSLENKISKTLVDTIIDLQMDDAPLLVKKGAKNIEKCASCGQGIPQANNTYYNNGSNDLGTSMTRFKLAKYKDKDKLPEISKTVGNKD